MKKVTFSCLALAILLQLIPSNGNAANIQDQKKKTNRTAMKQDTIPANPSKAPATSAKKEAEEGERNVMLNASDANKPREIQIGLPSEDVNVYENGLPAVYSSAVHKLAAHWRSDSGGSHGGGCSDDRKRCHGRADAGEPYGTEQYVCDKQGCGLSDQTDQPHYL